MGEDQHHADYSNFSSSSKKETLEQLVLSYTALSTDLTNWVANLSNASSLIWHAYHSLNLPVNWAGFYVVDPKDKSQLILGPFQGKVACQTIKIGKGVCGTAAGTENTQVVPNVDEFPGHIACDGETQSEIVVPIVGKDGVLRGVIDIDCLIKEGFNQIDQEFLEQLAGLIANGNDW
ncbi:hypothetical protein WICANDRAFT_29803 [Wickerhamomyces anomalus NRRL Y-366-8]|uniref:GAF domain-containing protein n=1 Tax=Wickerhamomyces anomalus (strain ATCC 58044 / CBS 1984 / NCYC 433 / NRRL Y-366-8) TaxID=683960 RepID=A0A1E3P3S1_WICAA|nr:uncharacterized protein WICANDRAFT_29803 [Wickerhamomyces anomalus NRRL Y-366-8]ODQ60129.1 hypothetical protein WICANDRAFT_29803 [Wickerhamomyces anomalus NRRL Y-366-8]